MDTIEAAKIIQQQVGELKESKHTIEELELQIKELKGKVKQLEEKVIPDTMMELGLTALTLATHERVTVKPYYFARLPTDEDHDMAIVKREVFFDWMRENGHGPIIKEAAEIIPNDADQMIMLKLFLDTCPMPADFKSTIHWKTLEAWFKEQCELGANLPLELFTNYTGFKATVK